MSVELNEISGWLDNLDIKHQLDNDDKIIRTALGGDVNLAIMIKAKDDGKTFELVANCIDMETEKFLKIKDHEHSGIVLPHLLYLNYKTKFGTWEYDPTDGEIRLAVEIPLEDALMTESQFKRIFEFVAGSVDTYYNEINKILETGELPKDDNDIEDLLMQMLLKAIKDRKTDSSNDEDGI